MEMDRRGKNRIDNEGFIRNVRIKGNLSKWEVIDVSLKGLKIKTLTKQEYKKGENIKAIVKFSNSGKEIEIDCVVKWTIWKLPYFEMGLSIDIQNF